MSSQEGNQIFVTVRKGKTYPPRTVDVRVKYEQTVAEIREAAARKLDIPVDKLQLFWHGSELGAADYARTLLDSNLHTGFALMGYDLTETPDYWPPVEKTPKGLVVQTK